MKQIAIFFGRWRGTSSSTLDAVRSGVTYQTKRCSYKQKYNNLSSEHLFAKCSFIYTFQFTRNPNGGSSNPKRWIWDPSAFCRSHSSSCLRFFNEFGSFNTGAFGKLSSHLVWESILQFISSFCGTFDVKMAQTSEIQQRCQQNSGLKEVAFNHGIFGVFIGPFLNSVTVDFSSFIKVLVTNTNRFTVPTVRGFWQPPGIHIELNGSMPSSKLPWQQKMYLSETILQRVISIATLVVGLPQGIDMHVIQYSQNRSSPKKSGCK